MLENKTIVVTGANGALGKAVCAVAERLGAATVQLDIVFSASAANRHEVDLTNAADVAGCFAKLGSYDAVLNIAGGFAMGADSWDDAQDWDNMFAINVTTLRNVLAVAVPALLAQGQGSIVNVGAYGALQGQPQMSAYCAAKGAVMRMTESLSGEVRERGINVNAVLPTIIDTPANRGGMPDADFDAWVKPEALADAICFLASDAARAVHGALLPVRGLS